MCSLSLSLLVISARDVHLHYISHYYITAKRRYFYVQLSTTTRRESGHVRAEKGDDPQIVRRREKRALSFRKRHLQTLPYIYKTGPEYVISSSYPPATDPFVKLAPLVATPPSAPDYYDTLRGPQVRARIKFRQIRFPPINYLIQEKGDPKKFKKL